MRKVLQENSFFLEITSESIGLNKFLVAQNVKNLFFRQPGKKVSRYFKKVGQIIG